MSNIEQYQGGMEPVTMDTSILDEIISHGGSSDFIKLTDAGYMLGDEVRKSFSARIVGNKLQYVRWEGNNCDKIDVTHGMSAPEGYELRCQLTLAIGGERYTLDLSKTSTQYQYSPYVAYLKRQNLTPADVVTRLGFVKKTNSYGSYNQATFEMVGTIEQAVEAVKNVTPPVQEQAPPPPPKQDLPSGW